MERFRKLGTRDKAHQNGVWALDAVSEVNRDRIGDFITGGCDGHLKTWRIRSESEMADDDGAEEGGENEISGPCDLKRTHTGHSLPVLSVAVARDVPTAASTSLDGTVRVWNLVSEEGESKTMQALNMAESWDVAISADGQRVLTGGVNGVVQVYDTSISALEQTFSIGQSQSDAKDTARRENPMVMSLALSEDGTQVATGAQDGSITVLDVETGKSVGGKFAKHGGPVRSISFLPSEPRTIITASDDQLVNFYDADTGHVTGTCRGHQGLALCARGSEDGRYVVSGGSDRWVHVWDRTMKEPVYTYKGHKDSVWAVSYALGGTRIISVADDGCISVLDSSNADTVA